MTAIPQQEEPYDTHAQDWIDNLRLRRVAATIEREHFPKQTPEEPTVCCFFVPWYQAHFLLTDSFFFITFLFTPYSR